MFPLRELPVFGYWDECRSFFFTSVKDFQPPINTNLLTFPNLTYKLVRSSLTLAERVTNISVSEFELSLPTVY